MNQIPANTSSRPKRLASRTVTLDRYRQYLSVTPAVPELAALTATCHLPFATPNGKFGVKSVREKLFEYHESLNLLVCWAGLEPVVLRVLRMAGYEIRWDRSVAALPEPDWLALNADLPVDRNLVQCVHDHPRTLIETGTDLINPAWLVAQVALAYPKSRVAALVPRNQSGRDLAQTLRRYVRAHFAHDGGPDLRDERVVVSNYSYAGFVWTDFHRWDIVLCFEALRALGSFPRDDLLSHVKTIRLYGLLPSGMLLAPRDRYELHELFGFKQISIPSHGCQGLPVDVVFAPIKGGPEILNSSVLDLKRAGIWQHAVRNRRIAQLALAFALGNHQKVAELCPAAAGLPALREGTTCIVLVENEEHRDAVERVLQRLGRQSYLHRYPSGGNRLWLVTFSEAWKVAWAKVDVMVRADGGVHLPPMPNPELLSIPCDSDHRLLLVDFDDKSRLRMRTRARKVAYQESGWLPPGADALEANVDRFLAARRRIKP